MHDKTLTPRSLPCSATPKPRGTAPHAAHSPAAPPKQIGLPTSFALQLPPNELHQHHQNPEQHPQPIGPASTLRISPVPVDTTESTLTRTSSTS
ncbi:uncharacterized protein MONOS_9027 [Monocercomonoides exilis]|uniref:uncharacterized protein n=1 Tax=Monocercomonoides exilis TaxID=2049356 RepID=UPI00355945B4|nr:hypothetical protein MONOS_9027 [Monocercomonoides exilis]|eukprot:MONOS_9027.1-p1 / transcript=MONOS_9027.1 / gene=MONOS_9027 / organism=Monocercomonoides_exilis_PA203 / gene_product=unspecified product / transcript_product=unspecified product / location=Mono_scaffold00358:50227-50508(+) / protein_length=94 / sequence_SO=supercontig / SO=protein_coding / is_pseudo=false